MENSCQSEKVYQSLMKGINNQQIETFNYNSIKHYWEGVIILLLLFYLGNNSRKRIFQYRNHRNSWHFNIFTDILPTINQAKKSNNPEITFCLLDSLWILFYERNLQPIYLFIWNNEYFYRNSFICKSCRTF
jgi:hypothetical protein